MNFEIKKIDYESRFQRLYQLLGRRALVLTSQPMSNRNSDVDFPYRQESFLYYLLGFDEAVCALVVAPDENGTMKRSIYL
nr:aminopeptidase P N-terminal domain-containing protein [Oligoflexales bacterium]